MTEMGLSLGRYVCVRRGRDGSDRVLMVVPPRLRPIGWPASIRLPQVGEFRGRLADPRFLARVVADAQHLNRRLDVRRLQDASAAANDRSMQTLAEKYFAWERFKRLSASRQYRNRRNVLNIVEWARARGNPDVTTLTRADVHDHLDQYPLDSATRFDLRSLWNMLFRTAIHQNWIQESPLERGDWNTPEPQPVRVWTTADVTAFSAMAARMGHPALGAMIELMFAVGQRPGDMRALRWGRDYNGQRMRFRQSKTRSAVNIPVDARLRKVIESVRVAGSEYLFSDSDTGGPFTAAKLSQQFTEVRHALTQDGEEKLLLRTLRHSCVCNLFKCGLNINEIAGITGHLLARVHHILERYFPDRYGAAASGMRKAFLAQGGRADEFGDMDEVVPLDWAEDEKRRATYIMPRMTERNFERQLAAKTGQNLRTFSYPPGLIDSLGQSDGELA